MLSTLVDAILELFNVANVDSAVKYSLVRSYATIIYRLASGSKKRIFAELLPMIDALSDEFASFLDEWLNDKDDDWIPESKHSIDTFVSIIISTIIELTPNRCMRVTLEQDDRNIRISFLLNTLKRVLIATICQTSDSYVVHHFSVDTIEDIDRLHLDDSLKTIHSACKRVLMCRGRHALWPDISFTARENQLMLEADRLVTNFHTLDQSNQSNQTEPAAKRSRVE